MHAEGLASALLFDEAVGVGTPLGHPLAGRASVTLDELADQPFVTAGPGHWIRRLLDPLFAARGLDLRLGRALTLSPSSTRGASRGCAPPRCA